MIHVCSKIVVAAGLLVERHHVLWQHSGALWTFEADFMEQVFMGHDLVPALRVVESVHEVYKRFWLELVPLSIGGAHVLALEKHGFELILLRFIIWKEISFD